MTPADPFDPSAPEPIVADVAALAAIPGRGAGTDAERRAAVWLADALRAAGREPRLETVWVRPRQALVAALHAVLAVAGGVVAISEPLIGAVVVAVVLVSSLLDLSGRAFLLRRFTPRRATQNVVAPPPTRRATQELVAPSAAATPRPVRLIVTAAYDAPRGAVVLRPSVRRILARLPRPFVVYALAMVALLGVAVARIPGVDGGWVGVAQLVPSVVLLLGAMACVDAWLAPVTPGAGESASAAAVALALVAALDREPPRSLAVDAVFAGAGDGPALGLRAYLRAHRRELPRDATVVLDIAACGSGAVHWWTSTGPLLPLPFHPRLAALCGEVAAGGGEASLSGPAADAGPHRGRGTAGARPARVARLPAITVGCLGDRGFAPGSGTAADTFDGLDPEAMAAALRFLRAFVAALDKDVTARLGG